MIYIIYKIYTIYTNINKKYTHWRVRARVRCLLWCQEDKVCRVECINRIVEQDLHGKKCTPKIEPRTEQLTLRDERKKHHQNGVTITLVLSQNWYYMNRIANPKRSIRFRTGVVVRLRRAPNVIVYKTCEE